MNKIDDLKETYLRRIKTAYEMLEDSSISEDQKIRLKTKISCYKYFVVELGR